MTGFAQVWRVLIDRIFIIASFASISISFGHFRSCSLTKNRIDFCAVCTQRRIYHPRYAKTALRIQHRTVFIAVFDEIWYTFLAASAAVKVLPASQVVMLPPASVGGCELLLRNTGPGPNGISSATGIGVPLPPFANAKGGMLHGVERCYAAASRHRRDGRPYIQNLMGNLSGDP